MQVHALFWCVKREQLEVASPGDWGWCLGKGAGQRLLQEPSFPISVLTPVLLSTVSSVWSAGSWQEGL